MPSKTAPLVFPKKGQAQPPADAAGRTAAEGRAPVEPVASAPAAFDSQLPAVPSATLAGHDAIAGDVAQAAEGESLAAAVAAMPGAEDLVQINVTVPRRIRNQLHLLKLTGQAKTVKAVTTEAVTNAVEQLLAQAGQGGKAGQ